jgi:hypothetical protein
LAVLVKTDLLAFVATVSFGSAEESQFRIGLEDGMQLLPAKETFALPSSALVSNGKNRATKAKSPCRQAACSLEVKRIG